MQRNEVWLAYVNDRIKPKHVDRPPVELRAWQTLALFFDLHRLFTERWDAISATPYSVEFDDEADLALLQLAATDKMSGWEQLSAGAWRVLAERLLYCEVVLAAMGAQEPEAIMDRLPQGLKAGQQAHALLLKYLLGHGRTIDRQVLPLRQDERLPTFPSSQSLRKH
jgi:hypothetical protein